jgi:hypothetical protein
METSALYGLSMQRNKHGFFLEFAKILQDFLTIFIINTHFSLLIIYIVNHKDTPWPSTK